MRRNLLIAALVLPLLVIVMGIVRSELHLAQGTLWAFDVDGYDPRDLLRGHFIQFRLDLHEESPNEECGDNDGDRCCLCLDKTNEGQPPLVRRISCESAQSQCDGLLQTRYLKELTRYYIPEQDAAKLETKFREAAARKQARLWVAIDKTGRPQIESLRLDGEVIQREKK